MPSVKGRALLQRITEPLRMGKIMYDLLTPQVRQWVYGIIAALMPILVIAGLSSELASSIALLVSAILGVGSNALAAVNVPRDDAGKHAAE